MDLELSYMLKRELNLHGKKLKKNTMMMIDIEKILYSPEEQEKIKNLREKQVKELKQKEEGKKFIKRLDNLVERKKDYSNVEVRDVFKKLSTRTLLKLRDFHYTGSYWSDNYEKEFTNWKQEQLEIRAELSTREHIPKKNEIKGRRRYLAKKNRGGRRSHKK